MISAESELGRHAYPSRRAQYPCAPGFRRSTQRRRSPCRNRCVKALHPMRGPGPEVREVVGMNLLRQADVRSLAGQVISQLFLSAEPPGSVSAIMRLLGYRSRATFYRDWRNTRFPLLPDDLVSCALAAKALQVKNRRPWRPCSWSDVARELQCDRRTLKRAISQFDSCPLIDPDVRRSASVPLMERSAH